MDEEFKIEVYFRGEKVSWAKDEFKMLIPGGIAKRIKNREFPDLYIIWGGIKFTPQGNTDFKR